MCTSAACMFTNPPDIGSLNRSGDTCTQCFFQGMQACYQQTLDKFSMVPDIPTWGNTLGSLSLQIFCISNVQHIAHRVGVEHTNSGRCRSYPDRTYCPDFWPGSYCDCQSFCVGCPAGNNFGACCIPDYGDLCGPFAPCAVGACNQFNQCPVQCPDPACEGALFPQTGGCTQRDNFIGP